jgi:hypothetical protein
MANESLAAAAAPDGRIYLVGGTVGGAAVATVIAYAPSERRYAAVAPLQGPRTGLGAVVGADGRIYAVGGATDTTRALRDVEAYGPVVTIAPSAPTAGRALSATGSNFAANAQVSVYVGETAGGTPLAVGATDGSGSLQTLALPPFDTAASYTLLFVDDRSRYPAHVRLTVAP